MAEQLDNQATNKSPWNFSTGNADPENPKAYRRESRGKANLNGGLMAVVGDMFDQFLELLSKLFGSLFDKNPEDVEYQKHSMETLNNDLARSIKHFGERPANLTQFSINDMNKIPEYGDKDIAKEYMNFTFYGTAYILQKDKGGQAAPVLMDNTENNFRKAFSVSLSQIKEIESNGKSELNATTPTIVWMMSPVYTSAFDKIVDKNSLIAGLSEKDKKLLKDAKLMDSTERKEFFKDKPGLEESFKKVQNTALAISGADILAKTQATEGGINSLSYSDFRVSASGQLGSLQLTMDTYFEKTRKMFSQEERLNEGNRIMQEMGISGSDLTPAQVRAFVGKVLGNNDFGGEKDVNGPGFLSSLEKKIADCKSKEELAEVLGAFAIGYKSEENYLAVQQSIMNDKTNFMIKALGGKDEVNNIVKKGDSIEIGDMVLRGANAISFNNGKTFTAMEVYDLIRKGEGQAAQSEKDAKFLLGELYKQDSKVLFLTVAHLAYHGNNKQGEVAKTFANVNLGGKSVLKANEFNKELEGNGLIAVSDNDYGNVSKLKMEQRLKDYEELAGLEEGREGKLNKLHLDPAFKDFDPNIPNSAKDIIARLEKANIDPKLKETQLFKDYVALLKEFPDKKIIGSPVEHLRAMHLQESKENQDKKYKNEYDIFSLSSDVLDLREKLDKKIDESIKEGKTNRDFILYMEADAARNAFLQQKIKETPGLKEMIDEIKKEGSLGNSKFEGFDKLEYFFYKNKDDLKKGVSLGTIATANNLSIFEKEEMARIDKLYGVFDNDISQREELKATYGDARAVYDRVSEMTAEVKRFSELYQNNKSEGHKDLIQNNNQLRDLLKIVSYGEERLSAMGLDYNQLKDILAKKMVENGMFDLGEDLKTQLEKANNFIEKLKNESVKVLNNNDTDSFSKILENALEKQYTKQEISSHLASFLIEKGLLTKDSLNRYGIFDSMEEITVRMQNGEKMNLLDFGITANGKNCAKEEYQAIFGKQEAEVKIANAKPNENGSIGIDITSIEKEQQKQKEQEEKIKKELVASSDNQFGLGSND